MSRFIEWRIKKFDGMEIFQRNQDYIIKDVAKIVVRQNSWNNYSYWTNNTMHRSELYKRTGFKKAMKEKR